MSRWGTLTLEQQRGVLDAVVLAVAGGGLPALEPALREELQMIGA